MAVLLQRGGRVESSFTPTITLNLIRSIVGCRITLTRLWASLLMHLSLLLPRLQSRRVSMQLFSCSLLIATRNNCIAKCRVRKSSQCMLFDIRCFLGCIAALL